MKPDPDAIDCKDIKGFQAANDYGSAVVAPRAPETGPKRLCLILKGTDPQPFFAVAELSSRVKLEQLITSLRRNAARIWPEE